MSQWLFAFSTCLQGGSMEAAITYTCAAGKVLSTSTCLTATAPLSAGYNLHHAGRDLHR
jgi:hypothetical protein